MNSSSHPDKGDRLGPPGPQNGPKSPPPRTEVAYLDPLIHEAGRLRIMALLRDGQYRPFSWMIKHTGLTRGNFASHVARLMEAGYVRQKKKIYRGTVTTEYALTPPGKAAFRGYCRAWRALCDPPKRRKGTDSLLDE